ncbi:MAG: hypothetical protein WDN69_29465 [Aliidongia sp.]
MRRLKPLALEFDAIVLSYEKLSDDPATLHLLMALLGIDIHPRQLEYERHVDTAAVRGDIGLTRQPRPISAASVVRRQRQAGEVSELIWPSAWLPTIRRIEVAISVLRKMPLSRAAQLLPLWEAVDEAAQLTP